MQRVQGISAVLELLFIFLMLISGVLFFDVLVYQLEELHTASKGLYAAINKNGFDGFKIEDVAVILLALMYVAVLIVALQVLKSLFDQFVKTPFDEWAGKLFNKFEKRTRK